MGFGIFRRIHSREKEQRSKQPMHKELEGFFDKKALFGVALIIYLAGGYLFMLRELTAIREDRRKEAAIQRICENDAQKLESILHELGKRESKENIQVYFFRNDKPVSVKFKVGKLIEEIRKCYNYNIQEKARALSLQGSKLIIVESSEVK
ncbi:MAG: hypothetical protein QXS91_03995 [Candidatus Anstonellales archaeon]